MKDRGNKPIKLDSLFKSSFGRYVTPASRSHFTISNHRLRWAVDGMRFTAPLPRLGGNEVVVKSPLSRGGHTHTHFRLLSVAGLDEVLPPRLADSEVRGDIRSSAGSELANGIGVGQNSPTVAKQGRNRSLAVRFAYLLPVCSLHGCAPAPLCAVLGSCLSVANRRTTFKMKWLMMMTN